MTLSFAEHLEGRLAAAPPKSKGERTKERLKIAAARLLGEKGYHALRVAEISSAASLAEGSFYIYFKDKADISLQVLTQLLEQFFDVTPASAGETSAFGVLRAANRRWIALCRANAGLLRCVFQLGDEIDAFARLSQRTNRIWYERVARNVLRRHKEGAIQFETILLAVYLLGAMMDELVRKLVVYPDDEFLAVLRKLKADDDDVADAASLVWLRILYPNATINEKLARTPAALQKLLVGGTS